MLLVMTYFLHYIIRDWFWH